VAMGALLVYHHAYTCSVQISEARYLVRYPEEGSIDSSWDPDVGVASS